MVKAITPPPNQPLIFENEHSRSLVRMAMFLEQQSLNEKKQKKMSPVELLTLDQKISTGVQTLWKTLEKTFQEPDAHIFEIKE